MKQIPPNAMSLITAIISSVVSLMVGIIGGGFAGYNGWKKNKIDATLAKSQAEDARLAKETAYNQSTSTLINDAMTLVKSLREEIDRLRKENEDLHSRIEELQKRLDTLETQNIQLRLAIQRVSSDKAGGAISEPA